MKKRTIRILAALLLLVVAAVNFPVYRLGKLAETRDYFSLWERMKALYIGAPWDRLGAREVMELADQAFGDVRHTQAENQEAYGVLSRYATAADFYGDVAFNEHSLELWSAHLGKEEGWLWVYYSSESVYPDGSTARGGWRIPSLWKVEKTESGAWVVTEIKEHP